MANTDNYIRVQKIDRDRYKLQYIENNKLIIESISYNFTLDIDICMFSAINSCKLVLWD